MNFRPHIRPVYPPDNHIIFEEWFAEVYSGCNTDRELLPFFPTSYWVNNNYAQDAIAKIDAQDYIDSLTNDKKYFVICQYDDGCLIDWKGKDVLEFNMSKTNGVMIPLLCQPHPYKFNSDKKWFVSFVGSRTHPCRNGIEKYVDKKNWYISYEPHSIENYCRILHESIFVLCPRGYGATSFRCAEGMQYNAIPIYISDEHIIPFGLDVNEYGILYNSSDISSLATMLAMLTDLDIIKKQERVKEVYQDIYTYDGCMNHIITTLETEFNNRQQK